MSRRAWLPTPTSRSSMRCRVSSSPLGLDGVALTQAHERLIHVWAPPYGETGRWSALPASHNVLTALTGISSGQASYAGSPVHLVAPLAYYGQANCMATAIGAALFERVRSGLGQRVVVSGLHGAAQVMPTTRFEHEQASIWRAPLGGAPNYRLYQCADGEWLFLGALFEALYVRALEATGVLADVLSDPQFAGDLSAALVAPGAQVTMRKLEAAFRTRARAEWLAVARGGRRAVRTGAHARGVVWWRDDRRERDAPRTGTSGARHGGDARRLAPDERDSGGHAASGGRRPGSSVAPRATTSARHGTCRRRTAARGCEGARSRRRDRGCVRRDDVGLLRCRRREDRDARAGIRSARTARASVSTTGESGGSSST